jgi:hypothetical protein
MSSDASNIKNSGVDCGVRDEPLPYFAKADCEHTIEGQNNSRIVLGRDRPGNKHTGYGGKNATQCGMIDLVVGGMSCQEGPQATFKSPSGVEEPIMIDPMFTPYLPLTHGQTREQVPVTWASDAARIYLSQMTDVDDNFNLPDGSIGNSKAKSAVAVKADAIRIIGNEGVQIFSNVDGTNSNGHETSNSGIDLIANGDGNTSNIEFEKSGNKTLLKAGPSLQPLVKGLNLKACVEEVLEEMILLSSSLQGFVNQVITANQYWGNHKHPPPVPYIDIMPKLDLVIASNDVSNKMELKTIESLKNHAANLENIKEKFLKSTSGCYINSNYNNTN